MARYFSEQTLLDMRYEDMNEIYDLYDLEEYLTEIPTADVAPKSEVVREIEALENEVGKIYNHYVFEDTDYADDDVAVEAAMNALTEVSNLIAEFKDKYTEEKEL